jgi:hypothetical protein
MSTEMIIMMIGLLPKMTSAKALTDFCESFSKKKKEEEQKNKEAELAELGILPKSGIS